MKEQERLDKVLNAAYTVAQDEVAALSGAALSLSEPVLALQTKEDAFEALAFKQALSKIDVRGDIEGEGCLVVPIKDAVRLGGILIMLPESELDEFVANENYSDEIEDSYGEIANIIAGAYSKAFEEMYPKACRLIRKEQEVINPAKIEVDADEPVKNQNYYTATHQITIGDAKLGNMVLMLPAVTFGLVEVPAEQPEEAVDDSTPEETVQPEAEAQVVEEAQPEQEAEPEEAEESGPAVVPFNSKNLEKINKIIEAAQATIAEEVTGLIGAELVIEETSCDFKKKEELLEDLDGKQVAAKMDIRGDIEGQGALFADLKGAIRLGGTLIMLPQTELEESVGRAEYNEETEDSYGEIANIIAGSYSKVFEEMYPKNCRLIRKEQEVVTPVKLDPDGEFPMPPQAYYVVTTEITLDSVASGKLVMALPAITFGILDQDNAIGPDVEEKAQSSITQKKAGDQSSVEDAEAEAPTSQQPPAKPDFDSDKQKEKIDNLLTTCTATMKEEVAAMLGTEVQLRPLENKLVSKEDLFFDEVSGKQVLAHMDVVGDEEEKCYFFAGLKDAIRIGGILIMLPPNELEIAVSEEEYTDDIQDAYGEIANIIAGVYTGVFEEQYKKKLRFIRKELENVVPMKVDISSAQPVPDQKYYIHALQLTIGDKELGTLHMAVPATLFQLENLGAVIESPTAVEEPETASQTEQKTAGEQDSTPLSVKEGGEVRSDYDVIVIGNDTVEMQKIVQVLQGKDMQPLELNFKDNIYNHVNANVKAVFLVMQEVNELGFGVAIKISTACSAPLIAAGSAWTRTKVIKAVKYGVADIVLTPATDDDIREKVENNLVKLAA